jgi:serine/threonine protein kinase
LPIAFCCECIQQIALALQHAHKRGLVHRDIKPANMVVAKDSKTGRPLVKLLDLGLARIEQDEPPSDGNITRSGQIMGSPDYMAPEQATNARNADIRSDIYGLGASLFHLISGSLPFSGGTVMEKLVARINSDAPPLSSFRDDVPPVLVHIVARMLQRDPAQRFQTPGEVAAVLEAFVTNPDSLSVEQFSVRVPRRIPTVEADADETLNLVVDFLGTHASESTLRRRKKTVWPLVVSILAAVVVVGGVLFALSRKAGPKTHSSRIAEQQQFNQLTLSLPVDQTGALCAVAGNHGAPFPSSKPFTTADHAATVSRSLTASRSETGNYFDIDSLANVFAAL